MFFLSVYQDKTISCYFTAAFKKARLSAGKGRPWLFFLCFIRQVSPAPRGYRDRFRTTDEDLPRDLGPALIGRRRFRGDSVALE
jgi:hypothetical protein